MNEFEIPVIHKRKRNIRVSASTLEDAKLKAEDYCYVEANGTVYTTEVDQEKLNTLYKDYHIPVVWQNWGLITIKARSLEEAKELALDAPLPIGEYIEDSFEIDEDGIPLHNDY